jgi:hypothetical protein
MTGVGRSDSLKSERAWPLRLLSSPGYLQALTCLDITPETNSAIKYGQKMERGARRPFREGLFPIYP